MSFIEILNCKSIAINNTDDFSFVKIDAKQKCNKRFLKTEFFSDTILKQGKWCHHWPMNVEKKYRILLAEDEPSIREALAEILMDEGFHCTSAFDGMDAVDKLEKENFDILISDFRMPRMNGAELVEWCREKKLELPVIFITANKNLLPEEKIAVTNGSLLLHKPLDINVLLSALEEVKTKNIEIPQ
ncbi:MAG: response regulator [Bacteriovoracia bacterium]